VVSSAISQKNPELINAQKNKRKVEKKLIQIIHSILELWWKTKCGIFQLQMDAT
jgi:hypothetical protein